MNIEILAEKEFKNFSLPEEALLRLDCCPLCKGKEGQKPLCVLEKGLEYSWCKTCCHAYVSRRPSSEWLANFYQTGFDQSRKLESKVFPGSAYFRGLARRSVTVFDLITNRRDTICDEIKSSVPNFCSPVLSKGQKVLDIGCGYGWVLGKFKDLGYLTYGIEGSVHRAKKTRTKGIPCKLQQVEKLTEQTFGTKFDLVTSNHVLEHVVDPNDFMASVNKVTDEGKHVCITVPNFYKDFLYNFFLTPVHLHNFTPRSLLLLLRKHGFHARKVSIDHQIRILAQKTNQALPEVYPFESEIVDEMNLQQYVMRNLLPGAPTGSNGTPDNGAYLVWWGPFTPEKFDFSRVLDQNFDLGVERLSQEKATAETYIDSLPEKPNRRVSICKVDSDGPALPVRITNRKHSFNQYWSCEY